jgi:hypothetical protein
MQESFGSGLGGRSRRARDGDDDELDLHGYTTGTHEPRKRPIRTNADSHTEAREFGTPVDCQRRSTTADAPSGGGSAGSNPVGGTTLQVPESLGCNLAAHRVKIDDDRLGQHMGNNSSSVRGSHHISHLVEAIPE